MYIADVFRVSIEFKLLVGNLNIKAMANSDVKIACANPKMFILVREVDKFHRKERDRVRFKWIRIAEVVAVATMEMSLWFKQNELVFCHGDEFVFSGFSTTVSSN